jgi:FkbM family methyltransferase
MAPGGPLGHLSCGPCANLKGLKLMTYPERLFNTLAALRHPGALREFFTSRAFSAPCFRLSWALKCHQPRLGTILDVGANAGQFALAAALHFPGSKIYSFEPLPEVFRELQENTRRRNNIRSFNCAIGNHNGHISFYRNQYSRLSSSLEINENNDNPRYIENNTSLTRVASFKLDHFSELIHFTHPVLLKIDVQGMEVDVIKGCTDLLPQIDFILCEAAVVLLYKEQPLIDDIHCLIGSLDYKLVAPLYINKGKNGKVIEVDLLYEKKTK